MYCEFYGLAEQPFNLTPDSKFLYLSRRHQEALAALVYGLENRKGFICLTGEIGSGKTTLYRTLLAQLDRAKYRVAVVLNSFLSDVEILQTINEEFGLPAKSESKKELLGELNEFLVRQFHAGVTVVLIVDESQNLRPETLEQIRMISNLETETDKLIQIVLVGQPQLQRTLALPELEQLAQRITVRHHVTPLSEEEVGEYIRHRLRVARARVEVKFEPRAVRLIVHYSKGVPRRINVICDRCLLVGYVMSRHTIDGDMVETAVREIRGEIKDDEGPGAKARADRGPGFPWGMIARAAALVVGLFGIVAGGVAFGVWMQSSAFEKSLAAANPAPSPTASPTPFVGGGTELASAPAGGGAEAPGGGTVSPDDPAFADSETGSAEALDAGAEPDLGEAIELGGPGEGDVENPTPEPTLTASPTPRPPPRLIPWTYDRDNVLRVARDDHSRAAAYVMVLRAWGIEAEMTTFSEAPPDAVSRYDLPAMIAQLQFGSHSAGSLASAMKYDLPMIARLTGGGLSSHVAILRMQGDILEIADPVYGSKSMRRKEIEDRIADLTILYREESRYRGLKQGSSGEAVADLQRLMNKIGKRAGEPDGKFGWRLKEAIAALQTDLKIPATGEIDSLTSMYLATRLKPDRPRLYS